MNKPIVRIFANYHPTFNKRGKRKPIKFHLMVLLKATDDHPTFYKILKK